MNGQLIVFKSNTMCYIDDGTRVGGPGWRFYTHPCVTAFKDAVAMLLGDEFAMFDSSTCHLRRALLAKNGELTVVYVCYRKRADAYEFVDHEV